MSIVKFLDDVKEPQVSELGGKGYSLAVLTNNGFNVPKAFIITAKAFFDFLKYNKLTKKIGKLAFEINKDNFQEKSKEIRNFILKGEIPQELIPEIKDYLNKLNVQYVSVRSSAVSEDSLKASFAGLHDTYLNIKTNLELVLENIKKSWASLFNERAVIYRIKKGIPHLEGIAVVIQEMIPAEAAGTTFTTYPDTGERNIMIVESSYGIGVAIVSGLVTPDRYIIDKNDIRIVRKILGRKKITVKPDENGIIQVDTLENKMNAFCLSDILINNLSKVCLNIEKLFAYPQDIEWCIHKNKIWILQSRSITSLEARV